MCPPPPNTHLYRLRRNGIRCGACHVQRCPRRGVVRVGGDFVSGEGGPVTENWVDNAQAAIRAAIDLDRFGTTQSLSNRGPR